MEYYLKIRHCHFISHPSRFTVYYYNPKLHWVTHAVDKETRLLSHCRDKDTDWVTGVQFPAGAMMGFSLRHRAQTGAGTQPTSSTTSTGCSYHGEKPPAREADHSLPSSAEVKNAWSYTSTSLMCLHGLVLNLTRDTSSCRSTR